MIELKVFTYLETQVPGKILQPNQSVFNHALYRSKNRGPVSGAA